MLQVGRGAQRLRAGGAQGDHAVQVGFAFHLKCLSWGNALKVNHVYTGNSKLIINSPCTLASEFGVSTSF